MGKSAILKKIHIATLNYNKLKKAPNLLDGIPFEQAGVFWFLPFSPQRLLRSFLLEPKHRKKKQCHIPDAASERVLDADEHLKHTATTEQMGYGIISFFCVLTPEGMNVIVFGEG